MDRKATPGYKIAAPIHIKAVNGKIFVDDNGSWRKMPEGIVTMIDAKKEEATLSVSKTAERKTDELKDASLMIVDDKSKTVVKPWTTGAVKQEMKLVPRDYKLVEVEAPEGYAIAELVVFRVTDDLTVEIQKDDDWVVAENNVVRKVDKLLKAPAKQKVYF